ncbi:unnamed protein product [Boreogadus saida]
MSKVLMEGLYFVTRAFFAPRRHARRVSAEVEHADRRRATSAERLPPLTYTAEEGASLTAAARRTPLTGAEGLPLLTAAVERTSPTDAESSASIVTAERTSPTAAGTTPPSAAAGMPIASPAPRDTFKLPRYADITALEPYLAQVGLAAANDQWNNQASAAHVALAPEGEAQQVLLDLTPTERLDYAILAAVLERRFGKRVSKDNMQDQLTRRRRQEGETLGTYAADVRFYARRGYPTFEEAALEELALGAFIHGLTPERLKEPLRIMAPTSLNAALDEAERVEAVMIPFKRPGPQVCRADVSDEEGNVEGRVVFQARPSPTRPDRR